VSTAYRSVARILEKMLAKGMAKLRSHIFVCTNERGADHPRGSCKPKNAEGLVQAFKETLAREGLRSEVRAQKAGCLDTCEYGPSVVVYPEGVWYGKVQLTDVSEIVQSHIKAGVPVARLLIPGK
jgi:(2Fe-2S) ferredoxin